MLEDLLPKQQELMDKVPHDVRPDALVRMKAGISVIESLLKYLNSTGHKPWRPVPLSKSVQDAMFTELKARMGVLKYVDIDEDAASKDFSHLPHYSRQLISALGVIEETVEYVATLRPTETREHQLEEITDILFFYLESIILSGFTPEEIEQEYVRKHAVNLERYRRGKEGDYEWDKRGEGGL